MPSRWGRGRWRSRGRNFNTQMQDMGPLDDLRPSRRMGQVHTARDNDEGDDFLNITPFDTQNPQPGAYLPETITFTNTSAYGKIIGTPM